MGQAVVISGHSPTVHSSAGAPKCPVHSVRDWLQVWHFDVLFVTPCADWANHHQMRTPLHSTIAVEQTSRAAPDNRASAPGGGPGCRWVLGSCSGAARQHTRCVSFVSVMYVTHSLSIAGKSERHLVEPCVEGLEHPILDDVGRWHDTKLDLLAARASATACVVYDTDRHPLKLLMMAGRGTGGGGRQRDAKHSHSSWDVRLCIRVLCEVHSVGAFWRLIDRCRCHRCSHLVRPCLHRGGNPLRSRRTLVRPRDSDCQSYFLFKYARHSTRASIPSHAAMHANSACTVAAFGCDQRCCTKSFRSSYWYSCLLAIAVRRSSATTPPCVHQLAV